MVSKAVLCFNFAVEKEVLLNVPFQFAKVAKDLGEIFSNDINNTN